MMEVQSSAVARHVKRTCESCSQSTSTIFVFFVSVLVGAFVWLQWISYMGVPSQTMHMNNNNNNIHNNTATSHRKPDLPALPTLPPLRCPNTTDHNNQQTTCPAMDKPLPGSLPPASSTCPSYLRWIHEDLRPWAKTGITLDVVERAQRFATFRLTIVDGRAYVLKYHPTFQTRDVFTLWGIAQLLRYYPGRLPDLDVMFDCFDFPMISAEDYQSEFAPPPPALFRYSAAEGALDVVFPDWSFWGWAEINIKPWAPLKKEIEEENKRIRWQDRIPYAYWKGNPEVAQVRKELMECNVSESHDWNARLYNQDWFKAAVQGYKDSDLSKQCTHKYKIFVEGCAWSVSEKYILACDSMTLFLKPKFYDFYTRGLMPGEHYWPIRDNNDKCRSIKYAVDWGNSHKKEAQEIGKAGSSFMLENLKMENVYNYMFHLLNEYGKLMRYKPTIPTNATELCSEMTVCHTDGNQRKFMMESMVHRPSETGPCELQPPFSEVEMETISKRKASSIKRVESWEEKAWATDQTR